MVPQQNRRFVGRHMDPSTSSYRFPALVLLFSGLLLLLGAIDASAQDGVVRGRVLDAEAGVPLPGANLLLQFPSTVEGEMGATAAGAAAGPNGRFELRLPSGSYVITVTYVGYLPWVSPIDVSSGAPLDLAVAMTPTDIEVNPITVTASRRPEKVLDAPASITVLGPEQLEARTVLTAAEYLQSAPGVDLIKTGLNSSRVVIRGFNDNLARSLLTLVDYRIAQAPSVRLTALQLIPLVTGDTEQIEIVSGPASALYGPNAANGVVHIRTKTPFESVGTQFSLAGGEQSVMLGSLRHAGVVGNRLGYKFGVQYYSGSDFEFNDPIEMEARQFAISEGASPDTLRIGARSFDVRNIGLNGRVDFHPLPDLSIILSGGITNGDNIEITPTGAAQVSDAQIGYMQVRLRYRDLFVQAYGNYLDSGNSYFLRTGEVFKDRSHMSVLQVQHQLAWGLRQRFTYGADYFHTIPQGEGTVTGRFEDRDQITEVGAYLQSETDLSTHFTAVGAARVDYHDRLDTWTLSPRAALVYKPRPEHSFRLTYNLAFKTPTAQELFADLLGQADVFELGQLEGTLGFPPTTDLRVQGMISGFTFPTSSTGRPLYRTPFAPLAGRSERDYIEVGDPDLTETMWTIARLASVEGLAQNLADSGLLSADQVGPIRTAMDAVLPEAVSDVGNILKQLNLSTQRFEEVEGPSDYGKLKITGTRTIELGYKGVLKRFIVLGADLYRTDIKDFLGPFEVGTPNVFLDPASLNSYLTQAVGSALEQPENAAAAEALLPLDELPLLGNRDGSAARELAGLISTGVAAAIPFGTVSPEEAFNPTAVILMRRSFGDISVYGLDLSVTAFLSRHLQLGGTYSYVSDNYFRNVDGVDDISLNAPRHKAGAMVFYTTPSERLGVQTRVRFVDGFPVKSDIYVGRVERFIVADVALTYKISFLRDTELNLTIENLTNNRHREFVFVPEIGRLAMIRLTHSF